MPVPAPLPDRFSATLRVRLRALFEHSVLDGGRQRVEAPPAGADALEVRVAVDGDTLRLLSFPEIEDTVDTAIGRIGAVVSVEGEPEGAFDTETGRIEIAVPIHLDAQHLLASDSDARLAMTTDGAVDQPELSAEGEPFDAGDPVVRLVGSGTFQDGSLDGGTMWLALDAEIVAVEEA